MFSLLILLGPVLASVFTLDGRLAWHMFSSQVRFVSVYQQWDPTTQSWREVESNPMLKKRHRLLKILRQKSSQTTLYSLGGLRSVQRAYLGECARRFPGQTFRCVLRWNWQGDRALHEEVLQSP